MKFGYSLGLLLLTFFLSCLKENKIILKQDFESLDLPKNPAILKGAAHSGNYYTRADSVYPFSASFSKNISEITDNKLKRIDVAAWIRKNDYQANAALIISFERDSKPVFWKAVPTGSAAPEINEWARMFASFDLPDSIGKNENIKIYIWNTEKLPIDADDFEIRLYY